MCQNLSVSDLHFGFIPGRSTDMASALAHDVTSYCLSKGSSSFLCSLDAEGAFDFIPHSILLFKAIDKVPDQCWLTLHSWYSNIHIRIRWAGTTSEPFHIQCGTRQGGLASPFMFNLFYQGLVEDISNSNRGILIDETSYNIFCYADDVLLASTTASGLQDLINIAVRYLKQHGLRFNPEKSLCMICGKNPLTDLPVWTIEETPLRIVDELSYLGTSIDNHSGTSHVEVRYFSLQGAGLSYNGLSPETARTVFNLGVRSAMLYGCHSVMVKDVKLKLLDRLQS